MWVYVTQHRFWIHPQVKTCKLLVKSHHVISPGMARVWGNPGQPGTMDVKWEWMAVSCCVCVYWWYVYNYIINIYYILILYNIYTRIYIYYVYNNAGLYNVYSSYVYVIFSALEEAGWHVLSNRTQESSRTTKIAEASWFFHQMSRHWVSILQHFACVS